MRKILITGAFGFVGRNLAWHLAGAGMEVWGLDVREAMADGTEGYRLRFDWIDLDRIPWGEVETVIHLAGKAHDTRRTAAPQEYFDVNLGLTERIYERVLAAPVRTFIQFSSVKAVADRVVGVLTEEAVPAPKTPYGQSKLAAERYLLAKSLPAERRLYILRPCMIHGPGNKGNLNQLYGFARRGLPYPLAAFDNRRSFTSIENLCHALDGLLRLAPPSGVYQMADDEPLSTNQLMDLMAESLGRRARSWRLHPGFVRWCARVGDGLHLPLNSERLDKLTENYVVSNAKLLRALGLERFPVSAEDGLRKTLAAFLGKG